VLALLVLLQGIAIVALRVPGEEPARYLDHPPRTRRAPSFGEGLSTDRFVTLSIGALRPGPGDPTVPPAALAAAISARGAPAAAALAAAARRAADPGLRDELLDLLRAAGFPAHAGG